MKILEKLAGLLFSPSKAWQGISREQDSLCYLLGAWLLPLALMVLLAGLASQLLHAELAPSQPHADLLNLVTPFLDMGAVLVVQLVLASVAVHLVAPLFGGKRQLGKAFALVFYSAAGLMIGSFLQVLLMPPFPIFFLLGAGWSVYLLLSGMPVMLGTIAQRSRILAGFVLVLVILVHMLIAPLVDQLRSTVSGPDTPALVELGFEASGGQRSVDKGPISNIQRADRMLNEAAREAGDASQRNDSLAAAQAARDAVTAIAATVAGGQERQPLTAAQLTDWFPAKLLGHDLTSIQVEPLGGMSSQAIMARGTYARAGRPGHDIDLRVIDPASVGSLLAESAASNDQGVRQAETESTVERSYREGARSVSEIRWKDTGLVEVSYVLANGVRVVAQASDVTARDLHDALQALPFERLEVDFTLPVGVEGETPEADPADRPDGRKPLGPLNMPSAQ